MAVTREQSGTQTATIGTDHELTSGTSPTTSGVRELHVDLNALALDEFVEISTEVKVLSAGSVRKQLIEAFRGGRTDPIVVTTPIATADGVTYRLKQVNGTGRSFPWAIMKIAD